MKNVELVTFDCPRWLRENCISGERLNIINPSTSFPRRLLHLPWNDWLLFSCWMHFAPGGTSSCAGAPRGAALVGIQNVSRRKWRIDRSIGKERERERSWRARTSGNFLYTRSGIQTVDWRDSSLRTILPLHPTTAHLRIYMHICVYVCVRTLSRRRGSASRGEPRLHCKNMRGVYYGGDLAMLSYVATIEVPLLR